MGSESKAGVYTITCVANGKVYVGSSINTTARLNTHFSSLKADRHHCRELQSDYTQYGRAVLVVEVFRFDASRIRIEEKKGIAYYRSRGLCYNVANVRTTKAAPIERYILKALVRDLKSRRRKRFLGATII